MLIGSNAFLVVVTVIDPSTASREAAMPISAKHFFTRGKHSRTYCSLYFGKIVAKEVSATIPEGFSSLPTGPGSSHPSGISHFLFINSIGRIYLLFHDAFSIKIPFLRFG